MDETTKTGIGHLGERSLHAGLRNYLAEPADRFEVFIDGYWIDIYRPPWLIEIQTRNFAALKTKLTRLLPAYPIRLVYPIAQTRWVVRVDQEKRIISRRKSPKRGSIADLFYEMPRLALLASHPNFQLQILFIEEERLLMDDGKGSWRRKGWSIIDRCLLSVVGERIFSCSEDYLNLLPANLNEPFSSRELAQALGWRRNLAQKLVYSLRTLGGIQSCGKRGNSLLYRR